MPAESNMKRKLYAEGRAVLKSAAHFQEVLLPAYGDGANLTNGERKFYDLGQSLVKSVYGTNFESRPSVDIQKRFLKLKKFVELIARGGVNGLLVRGSGGFGKTFTVTSSLEAASVPFSVVRGYSSNASLYNYLYQHRTELIVLDDVDSIFDDLTGINILKSVLDTNRERLVCWNSTSSVIEVPSFIFTGRIIFISNMTSLTKNPHMEALLTRVLSIDLTMTREEMLDRIRHIAKTSEFEGLSRTERMQVAHFIKVNEASIQKLNLRVYHHACTLYKTDRREWRDLLRFWWANLR